MKSCTLTSSLVFLGAELAAAIFVRAHQFSLLRIDGDGWLVRLQLSADHFLDVLELRVSVQVLRAFEPLAVRLKAIAELFEQPRHHLRVRLMALLRERINDIS